MSQIPEEWIESTIEDICALNPKEKLEDELDVGFMPMPGVPTTFYDKSVFEIRKWEKVKKGYTQFKNEDILFAKITPCFENSKAVIVKDFPNGWGAGSTEFYVLRPYGGLVKSQLLLALVKSYHFLFEGAMNMTGAVGHRRVPKDFVLSYPFPLPPLAEQKEIARRLDDLLTQVDTLKARLDNIPAILKRFRQSVLAAAVSGKLTEEWRKENGSSVSESCLEDLGMISGGKTPSKSNSDYWENGSVPWVSPKDMKSDFITTSMDTITERAVEEAGMKLIPSKSILMVTRSGILAHSFPVGFTTIPVTINQDIKAFVPDLNKIVPEYSAILLRGLEGRILTECSKDGTTVASIETKLLTSLKFLLPSIQEQTEIVRRVEQLFAFADKIEEKVNNAQNRVDKLTQSILKKAFQGDLTADLPCRQAGWREQNFKNYSGKLVPENSDGYYAYVLECNDGTLYKGFTSDLFERINRHLEGHGAKKTKESKPVSLIHFEEFDTQAEAIEREQYFKSGSGREWLYKLREERKLENSAEALLEKIKAEREALKPAKKTRKKSKA